MDDLLDGRGVVVFGEGIELHRRERVSASGNIKTRYTIDVRSEKLVFNVEPKALGKPVAEAIIAVLRERIEGISERAAPNTIRARETAARALAKGKAWATKRYAGGRTGEMMPGQSDRLFNDSGRFAKTIKATANEDSWVINAAANRLSPDSLDGRGARGGEVALQGIWDRLRSLVPEIGDPAALMDDLRVRGAMEKTMEHMIEKTSSENVDLALEIMEQAVRLLTEADELLGVG